MGREGETVAVGFRREKATKEAKVNLVLAEENCKILKFFFDIKPQNKCPSLLITMVSHSLHAAAAPSPLGTRCAPLSLLLIFILLYTVTYF